MLERDGKQIIPPGWVQAATKPSGKHLAVGTAPRVARFYRGRDCVAWLHDMGHYDMPITEHPQGLKARKVLVKNVSTMHPLLANCLRLTVGTADENTQMLAALQASL